jgi:hypothetical protein
MLVGAFHLKRTFSLDFDISFFVNKNVHSVQVWDQIFIVLKLAILILAHFFKFKIFVGLVWNFFIYTQHIPQDW